MTTLDLDDVAALAAAGLSDARIGAALGVSGRTVLRARSRAGIPSTWRPTLAPCGTEAAYRRGCHCPACRAAHTTAAAAWRRARAYRRWEAIDAR